MWIDRVVELERGKRLVAIKNISLAEEHLHDHFAADAARDLPAAPIMPFSLVIEGMAQTAGILVGHANDFKEKVILAKIGGASIEREPLPGHTLCYSAEITQMDAAGAATKGAIDLLDHADGGASWQRIGEIDLMFSHIDANRSGQVFPEHNFVFGEGFKTLLRTSGVPLKN